MHIKVLIISLETQKVSDCHRTPPSQRFILSSRYLFNDAEVKPFDSAQLASECFGGEMTV